MDRDNPTAALFDELLVERIRTAPNALVLDELFQELFHRYRARVTDWCFRIVRDPDRASDLAQEVFLRAFLRLDSFRGDSRFSTWLYTITRNHCFNAIKKYSNDALRDELPPDLPGSDGRDVHRAVERKESFRSLWALMQDTLTPVEIQVVAMHYGHEVPLADLTQRLFLQNPSGAKAYIVNARRKLSAALKNPERRIGVNHSSASANFARSAAC